MPTHGGRMLRRIAAAGAVLIQRAYAQQPWLLTLDDAGGALPQKYFLNLLAPNRSAPDPNEGQSARSALPAVCLLITPAMAKKTAMKVVLVGS